MRMLRPIDGEGTSNCSIGRPSRENAAAVADNPVTPTKLGNTTAMRPAIISRRAETRRHFSNNRLTCSPVSVCVHGKLAVRESEPNCPTRGVIGLLSTASAAGAVKPAYVSASATRDNGRRLPPEPQ